MTPSEVLTALLRSYRRYYNIQTEAVEAPFAAEAIFHSHDERYFLSRRAKLSETEDHEYVFFATLDRLTPADVRRLDECAWERGCSRVQPNANHRSSDVVLVILAEHIEPEAARAVRALRHSQNYFFLLHGWSSFRAIALETSSGALFWNRRGRDLAKLFGNIHL